jgi:hypothetical protein
LIESEQQEMEALFYLHANPVRAGVVRDARNYSWSTHKLYGFGIREEWMRNVRFPKWYLKLGRTMSYRQRAYRQLFAQYLEKHGPKKLSFLKRRFFGSPIWTQQREDAIIQWRKQRAAPS